MKLIQLLVKYKTGNSYSKQAHAHAAALAKWGGVLRTSPPKMRLKIEAISIN